MSNMKYFVIFFLMFSISLHAGLDQKRKIFDEKLSFYKNNINEFINNHEAFFILSFIYTCLNGEYTDDICKYYNAPEKLRFYGKFNKMYKDSYYQLISDEGSYQLKRFEIENSIIYKGYYLYVNDQIYYELFCINYSLFGNEYDYDFILYCYKDGKSFKSIKYNSHGEIKYIIRTYFDNKTIKIKRF